VKRWRLVLGAAVVAAVVLAVVYLRCGAGWGLGVGSSGNGDGRAVALTGSGSGVARCAVKVTAAGLLLDGRLAPRDAVVAACKAAGGAVVIVVGNAREGDWLDLRQALEAAGVTVLRAGS
jgi:hypothetical protein